MASGQDDWAQMSAQTEEAAVTEEDLELIKERETNIRQLEVGVFRSSSVARSKCASPPPPAVS